MPSTTSSSVSAVTIGRGFDLQTKCVGRGDAGRRYGLSLARQHGQDHVAAGDARFQRLGAGSLDRAEPMIEDRAQYLDELALAVGVRLQLGADLGQRGR